MRDDDPMILDEAIDWHLRQADMPDHAWKEFVAWLERNPAHAAAYDRIAMQDRLIARPEPVAVPANDDLPVRRRWPLLAGGGIAAAIAAALLIPVLRAPSAQPYVVQTAPGQHQVVQLADGSRIDVSGGSRLQLDRADPRIASLDSGEAVFTVRHDPAHPFVLRSGNFEIRDLGTVFNVSRAGPRLDVQVSEGSVAFDPDGRAIRLAVGDALTAREDRREISRARVPVETVGEWRSGTLRFGGDPLPAVIATIRRQYGTSLVLEGDLPGRSFTGMLHFTGAADQDIPHLAALMGVGWRRNGEQWILAPRAAASR